MAVTGRFEADFADFISAIQKSDVALVDLSKGAGRVEGALNRMTDSFSGRKVIQDALLMATAVEHMGGTSKLTADELDRVARKASEATDKMLALGIQVPPGIVALADAAKPIPERLSAVGAVADQLTGQLAGLFSIGAILAFGREVLQAGDSIQKMADQTGLSTIEVQKLNFIAGQSGTSIGSLVGAVQNLEQRLGDNNTGAVAAVKRLGINFADFSKQSPYEQLVSVAAAINALPTPTQQAAAAADVFGKSWKEILPAIKAGMQDVGDQAPIMSDATVKSLDATGDAMNRAKIAAVAWAGETIARFEQIRKATGGITDDEIKAAEAQLRAAAAAKAHGLAMDVALPSTSRMSDALAALAISAEEADRISKQLTVNLTLQEIETEANAKAIIAEIDAEKALGELHKATIKLSKDITAERDRQAAVVNAAVKSEFDAQQELNRLYSGESVSALRTYERELDALHGKRAEGISQAAQEQILIDKFTRALYDEAVAQDKAAAANAEGNKVAKDTPAALGAATTAIYSFQGALISTNAELARFHAAFANEVGTFSKFSVGTPGAPATRFVPGFAGGVSNFGGGAAVVGERGPELVNLPRGSSVIPLGGGGSTLNVTINLKGSVLATRAELARSISDAMTTRLSAIGFRFQTGI